MAAAKKKKAELELLDAEDGPDAKGALAMRELLAAQAAPQTTGSRYPIEVIDRALLECALMGGNANRASRNLADMGITVPGNRIRIWMKGRYRQRYEELVSGKADEIREHVARQQLDFAERAQQVKVDALERVQTGLASTDAIEASMILRNVAAAEQSALANEAQLRGRAGLKVEVTGLDELMGRLAKLGIAEVVEGEGEEIPDAEVVG